MLFHAFPKYFPGGYLGVDAFFVISGYLVIPRIVRIVEHESIRNQLREFRHFGISRIARLIPALTGLMTAYAAPMLFIASFEDLPSIVKQMWASIFGLGNLGAYLFSGNYFSLHQNPFLHTWSLAVEMQLYIFFPVLLLLLRGIFRKRLSTSLVLWGLTVFSLFVTFWPGTMESLYMKAGISDQSTFNYYSLAPRIWEFAFGGILAINPKSMSVLIRPLRRISPREKYIGLLFIMLLSPLLNLNSTISIMLVNIVSLGILTDSSQNLTSNFLSHLGDISYSLYLVHLPNLYLAHQLFTSLHLPSAIGAGVGLLGSYPVALASYSLLENRKQYRGKPNSWLRLRKSLGLFATAVMALSLATFALEGCNLFKEKLISKATYAGWSDPNCERDSFNGAGCKYGPPAKKEVLLIGDSRAGMLSSTVIDVATGMGLRTYVWVHSGCRFNTSDQEKLTARCLFNTQRAIDYIETEKPYAVIISESIPAGESVRDLVDSIKEVIKYSNKTIVISPIPVIADQNFNRSGSILFPSSDYPTILLRKKLDIQTEYNRKLFLAELRKNKINFVDPFLYLCSSKSCSLKVHGKKLYKDNNHLTPEGAKILSSAIHNAMNQ